MKSILKIYAKTSKGNDNLLLNQLKSINLKPKYDSHLNSFYFDSTFHNLFDISFKSLAVEQMYVQIGQKFKIIDQQQIKFQLQRLPFKNYIPIQRGLIQNTTLKILIRESNIAPSENVLQNLVTTYFSKQIIKKEYYKQILDSGQKQGLLGQNSKKTMNYLRLRKGNESFFDIKDIVEKKWYQQDEILQNNNKQNLLRLEKQLIQLKEKQNKKVLSFQNKIGTQKHDFLNTGITEYENFQSQIIRLNKELQNYKNFDKEKHLQQLLAYHPHLIFYIRKNSGRFLLKINKEDLYKHGWKQSVNWGPIRESIAATAIYKSNILKHQPQFNKQISPNQEKQQKILKNSLKYPPTLNSKILKIWDPMCGSGTIPLVLATILDEIPIRNNVDKCFEWKNWAVYRQEYLKEYQKEKILQNNKKKVQYKLIFSDNDRQTINYSINNFRTLLNSSKRVLNNDFSNLDSKLFPNKKPSSQVLELIQNKIGFACGDFQEIFKILIDQKNSQEDSKLNIITNLPYLYGRSSQKHPINQLISIYRRFSKMISDNRKYIDNVFIIIDKNIKDRNHFLNVSQQKWTLISNFTSGGMEIGFYGWEENKLKPSFEQNTEIQSFQEGELNSTERQMVLRGGKSVQKALLEYRQKMSVIDRKYYKLPNYLMKDYTGRKRIQEKRRRRHLLSAYELFSRRRDKLIALKQYARDKLQIRMLRRGTVWKNKNLKLFTQKENLQKYSQQIKQMFEDKIEKAIKRQQDFKEKRKLKQGNKVQVAKIRNKWNNDQKYMVKQIKNSNKRPQKLNNQRSRINKSK